MPIFFNRYNSYLKFPLLNCITLVFSMFTRLYNHHQYVILSSVVEHLPTMHGAWVLSQAPQNKDKTNQTKLFSRTCLPSPKRPIPFGHHRPSRLHQPRRPRSLCHHGLVFSVHFTPVQSHSGSSLASGLIHLVRCF
jgi:hypothetical protein